LGPMEHRKMESRGLLGGETSDVGRVDSKGGVLSGWGMGAIGRSKASKLRQGTVPNWKTLKSTVEGIGHKAVVFKKRGRTRG